VNEVAEQVHVERSAESSAPASRRHARAPRAPWPQIVRVSANLVGAIGAAYFVRATWQFYQQTHRLIGAVFLVEQTWIVVAYLVRRAARAVTRRPADWLLAFAGTFGGVLFRPVVTHPSWGMGVGLALQLVGLALCIVSFLSLGRSFGFAAADRGLVSRGAYTVVRHPVYASYVVLHLGYVVQSTSWWNVLVMLFVIGCNIGRALAEERVLATNAAFDAYRHRVRYRLVPGVW